MMTPTRLPEQWRPVAKNSIGRSPLVRSSAAFTLSAALATFPHLPGGPTDGAVLASIYVLALAALVVGILVLLQSAAIRRIRHLRNSSKKQLDELSRCTLYSEQVQRSLAELVDFRSQAGDRDAPALVQRILDSAATPAKALDPSVRFYVVETTVERHLVVARSGNEIFPIDPGKSCSTDRTLEEVADSLGAFSSITPLSLRGGRCNLVMLSDSFPTRADRGFVEQLGLLLCLAADDPPRGRSQVRRGKAILRAV